MNIRWTDAMTDRAEKLWKEGWSASQIAREIGQGLTRNAVISKLHRIGAMGGSRAEPAKPNLGAARPRRPRPEPVAKTAAAADDIATWSMPAAPVVADADIVCLGVDYASGPDRRCAWPIGDPRAASFRFCHEPVVRGRAYCGPHCRSAGQSAKPRPMTAMGRVARPYRLPAGA